MYFHDQQWCLLLGFEDDCYPNLQFILLQYHLGVCSHLKFTFLGSFGPKKGNDTFSPGFTLSFLRSNLKIQKKKTALYWAKHPRMCVQMMVFLPAKKACKMCKRVKTVPGITAFHTNEDLLQQNCDGQWEEPGLLAHSVLHRVTSCDIMSCFGVRLDVFGPRCVHISVESHQGSESDTLITFGPLVWCAPEFGFRVCFNQTKHANI